MEINTHDADFVQSFVRDRLVIISPVSALQNFVRDLGPTKNERNVLGNVFTFVALMAGGEASRASSDANTCSTCLRVENHQHPAFLILLKRHWKEW